MKVLIIGGGGREHALAWKVARSPQAEHVFVAPGNAGTALEPGVSNISVAADDIAGLLHFAEDNDINLTIVGPEAALVAGVVDTFRDAGLAIFGPARDAARLEGSKTFAKEFMQRHRIPTARYQRFTDAKAAQDFVREHGTPLVIKADGLAAGKGVVVAHERHDALEAVQAMLEADKYGQAGREIVIEEFLEGEEVSFICMVDGSNVLPLATSQDHKARDDGDRGPNTGGMGAYSPAALVDEGLHQHILKEVIEPTVAGLASEGVPYTGFLYAGLMVDHTGRPRVLEFNCRLGDPETQPILARLRSDLVELCLTALRGELDRAQAEWDPRAALGVVLAAGGYPADYRRGDLIQGLDTAAGQDVKVFHAGTRLQGSDVVTDGGRVLCVVGLGDDARAAQRTAYEAVADVQWDGMFYRRDIGYRAIERLG